MRERILKVAAQLAKKMADGLLAEPSAPERHRALGVADAYHLLQNEFPDLFESKEEAKDGIRMASADLSASKRSQHLHQTPSANHEFLPNEGQQPIP